MEENDRYHGVRRPEVHPAQNAAERHRRVQILHPAIGLLGRRHIDKHQQEAGNGQQGEQVQGKQAEAERVGKPEGVLFNLCRLDVQQKRVEERFRPFALGFRECGRPVDGLVDVVAEDTRVEVVPDFRGLPVNGFSQARDRPVFHRAASIPGTIRRRRL